MALAALESKFWSAFCTAVGHPEWEPRQYAPDQPQLAAELAALFASQPMAHWQKLLENCDCCCEPVSTLEGLRQQPQVAHRALLSDFQGRSGEEAASKAPRCGQDSAQLLAALGYSDADVEHLRHEGVV